MVGFGRSHFDWVGQYIAKQQEHHANGQARDRVERITDLVDGMSEDMTVKSG